MFGGQEQHFVSESQSSICSSVTHSLNTPFSSDASWDSESLAGTPTSHISNHGQAYEGIKVDDSRFSTSAPVCSDAFRPDHGLIQMTSMNQDLIPVLQDHSMLFQGDNSRLPNHDSIMDYSGFSTFSGSMCESFDSSHGLPTPSLDFDEYSPSSSHGSDSLEPFVVPSQTTFLNTFELQSPLRPVRALQLDLQYGSQSPVSDYAAGYPLVETPSKYCMSSSYSHSSSTTTPSRTAARQPMLQPLASSTALHRIQELPQSDRQSQAGRQARRRIKREYRDCSIPNNISVQNKAKKKCTYPGCSSRFQRQEHLKRHEKTHEDIDGVPCQFCQKKFNRSDNLKSHIKLHATPSKKSSRTKFFPAAIVVWEQMNSKPRKAESLKTEMKAPKPRVLDY